MAVTVCASEPGDGVSVSDGPDGGRAAASTGSGDDGDRLWLLLGPRRPRRRPDRRGRLDGGRDRQRLGLRRVDRHDARRRRRRIEQRHLGLGAHLCLRGARTQRHRQQQERKPRSRRIIAIVIRLRRLILGRLRRDQDVTGIAGNSTMNDVPTPTVDSTSIMPL